MQMVNQIKLVYITTAEINTFKGKNTARDSMCCIIIKGLIHHEDIKIIYIYKTLNI